MEKKNLLIIVGTIVAIIVPLAIYSSTTKPKQNSGQTDQFAQCLTDKGARFYGAFWCSHCTAQKKSFGESFEKINYIECSTPDGKNQMKECEEAGINGYPTWKFADGSIVEGEASFEVLSQKTGCELTK